MEPDKVDLLMTGAIITKVDNGVWALGGALRNKSMACKPEDRLPIEREFQIQKFLAHTRVYIYDLREWHGKGRMDLLAQTLRSLMELNVWIEFCNVSEDNWRQFVEDAVRDLRELSKATIKLYEGKDKEIEEKLTKEFAEMEKEAERRGIKEFRRRYMMVREAADAIGRGEIYSAMYKIASKYAHPTALFFAINEPMPLVNDGLYAEGARVAGECLNGCQRSIAAKYPKLFKPQESTPENPSKSGSGAD
jgi:Family of unknown function (DUF5677)